MSAASAGRGRDPSGWRRVLVRMPNWVGDVVMATPALRALRRRLPEARITVALKGYVLPVIAGSPDYDEALVLPKDGDRLLGGGLAFAREVRRRAFDAAFIFTNSLTSALPIAIARVPRRIGYRGDLRGPLLTDGFEHVRAEGRRVPLPMARIYLDLLARAGIPAAGPEYLVPVLAEDRARAAAILDALGHDPARPLAAINPGARFGSSKLWMPERFAAVARGLRERGFAPLVLCAPGEEPIAARIASLAGAGVLDTSRSPVPLDVLRGLLERASLMVTTDTGPRHMATALGKPTVVVMGSTHPAWTAWNLERTEVLRHDVPCGPCHLRSCPVDHACMALVSVEEVLAAADRLLGRVAAP